MDGRGDLVPCRREVVEKSRRHYILTLSVMKQSKNVVEVPSGHIKVTRTRVVFEGLAVEYFLYLRT